MRFDEPMLCSPVSTRTRTSRVLLSRGHLGALLGFALLGCDPIGPKGPEAAALADVGAMPLDGQPYTPDGGPGLTDTGVSVMDSGLGPLDGGGPADGIPTVGIPPDQVDLVVSELSLASTSVQPGSGLLVRVRASNLSPTESAEPSALRLELYPSDPPGSSSLIGISQVWMGPLAASARVTATVALSIAPTLAPRLYRLRASIDPEDVVAEFDESNNSLDSSDIAVSDVVVIPSRLSFEPTGLGCSREAEFVIENRGIVSANIQELGPSTNTSTAFLLLGRAPPIALQSGESTRYSVTFAPNTVQSFGGELLLTHDRMLGPMPIQLSGPGVTEQAGHETFEPSGQIPVDIMLVVDSSCSMAEEQQLHASELASFLQTAIAQQIDFRLAVTSTDLTQAGAQGRFLGAPPVLDRTSANVVSEARARVLLGTTGSGVEQGLRASQAALSEPLLSTSNAGFVRAGASLIVIYLSDEDDQSPGDAADYADFLRGLPQTLGSDSVAAHAIVGPAPSGCTWAGGQAQAGTRYIALSDATAGAVATICARGWAQALASSVSSMRHRFVLRGVPRPDTLRVHVDQVPLLSQDPGSGEIVWTFDAATNAIVFSPSEAPPTGAQIDVYYSGC